MANIMSLHEIRNYLCFDSMQYFYSHSKRQRESLHCDINSTNRQTIPIAIRDLIKTNGIQLQIIYRRHFAPN